MTSKRRLSRARLAGGSVVIFFGVVVLLLAVLVAISALNPEPGDDNRTVPATVAFLGVVGVLIVGVGVVILRRRPPEPATQRVRLWVHGRFGYQDVLLLLFPIAGTALIVVSMLLPAYIAGLPQQAGSFTATACGYFEEEDRDTYKCAGEFAPGDGADAWTLPPHIWVGEGDLPDPGESMAATLLADGGVVVGDPKLDGSMLAFGVVLGLVGLPIVIMYLSNFSRYFTLRRRYPGVDVIERRGWPSAGGGVAPTAVRARLRSRARSSMIVLGLFLCLLTIGLVAALGTMAAERFGPGRVAASVTVDWCTDSGDLSGPGFRPLVTCTATAEDGSLVEFHPESRVYLPVGDTVNGEFTDAGFVDRSMGIGADPLIPVLAVLAAAWVLVALVFWANASEVRRLKRTEPSSEDVLVS
jgi:hypothetical protein